MQKNQIKLIKYISVGLIACIILIVGGVRAYHQIDHAKQMRETHNKLIYKQLLSIYSDKIESITSDMLLRSRVIANSVEAIESIKAKDRQRLMDFSLKRYKAIRGAYGSLNRMHFHLPNHTSFLRVHKPSEYGDNLEGKREIIDFVIKNHMAAYGFENGMHDNENITFRVAQPIFDTRDGKREFLGVLEFGVDFIIITSELTSYLQKIYSTEIFVKNLLLPNALTPLQLQSAKKFDTYVYFDTGDTVSHFMKMLTTPLEKMAKVRFGSKEFTVNWGRVELKDYRGNTIGTPLYAIDNTSDNALIQKTILYSILEPLLVAFLMIIVLHYAFVMIVKRLDEVYKKSKMTMDLQKSIIVVTDKSHLLEANKSFYDFFGFIDLEDFKSNHECICDFFIEDSKRGYLSKKDWLVFDFDDNDRTYKVWMQDRFSEDRYFQIISQKFVDGTYLVSFHDITPLEKMQTELNTLNRNLDLKVKKMLEESKRKDQLLQQQSKLASMGEMIGAIAHQWRQPLNALNINIQNLEEDFEEGLIDEAFIEEFMQKNRSIIEFMSKTIDDFRNFFRIDKQKQLFSVKEVINDVISIQSAQLKNYNISVELLGEDFSIDGFKSEFGQVFLNLINNSKDAIVENKIQDGHIVITLKSRTITVEDNGGGIPSDIVEKVFEPYFTTKDQGKGTGMGLYMSKMIIENNMGGVITAKNGQRGVIISVDFGETKNDR